MSSGVSAPDIITYIGIPLAVLGVLPIFYSFIRAIVVQRSIRRILQRHDLLRSAVTRGSLMEGIVEVELPRCTITPLDRDEDPDYWKLNSYRLSLKGGSWTTFSWNTLVTGKQVYRCQYKDELQIPEADIDFEDLVAFLLDRGAVPDPQGWRMLKTIGLWTPTGTKLLLPPRGHHGCALKVIPPNNADGVLSLHVDWNENWDSRGTHSLPPFWVRLEQPAHGKFLAENSGTIVESPTVERQDSSPVDDNDTSKNFAGISRENTLVAESSSNPESSSTTRSIMEIIEDRKGSITTIPSDSIRFKVDGDHIHKVFFEDECVPTGESLETTNLGDTGSLWFISAASALGSSQTSSSSSELWTFKIPSHITTFVERKSIPCGVMVILDMLQMSDVPPWASPRPPLQESTEETSERLTREMYERRLEDAMPPAQAAEARRVRQMRQTHEFHAQHNARRRALNQYQENLDIEAIQSPRLENSTVASATLAYLVREKIVPEHYKIQDVAYAVLYLMMLDQNETGKIVADILERWTLWNQFGGMQKAQLDILKQNKIAFCYAAALVAAVRLAQGEEANGSSSSDMLECLTLWKRVRLG